MELINIKPLSVNEAWQGRRFKTPKYKKYEQDVLMLLPRINMPKPPFKVYLKFGLSSLLADIDNPVKPILDILQKKYGINDKDIQEMHTYKVLTKKGKEFIQFSIESVDLF